MGEQERADVEQVRGRACICDLLTEVHCRRPCTSSMEISVEY